MDIAGTMVCECSKLRSTVCPKSQELLSLHYIDKMPDHVKRLTVSKIKKTRQGVSCGNLWNPLSHASAICILKFLNCPLGQTTQLCL